MIDAFASMFLLCCSGHSSFTTNPWTPIHTAADYADDCNTPLQIWYYRSLCKCSGPLCFCSGLQCVWNNLYRVQKLKPRIVWTKSIFDRNRTHVWFKRIKNHVKYLNCNLFVMLITGNLTWVYFIFSPWQSELC